MLAETIKYRALIYAAIYAPSRPIPRKEATKLYNALAESVFQNLSFKYTPEGEGTKFCVEMVEKQGRQDNRIVLDIQKPQSLRVLLHQAWPDSSRVACDNADEVFRHVKDLASNREMQMAEARVRAQVSPSERPAIAFLGMNLLGEKARRLDTLGDVSHLGVRYDVQPDFPATHALGGALRNVTAETLGEDRDCLYLEVMSQWGRRGVQLVDPEKREAKLVPGPLEIQTQPPSKYLEEVMEYVAQRLCPFLEGKA
jgi:hypothetical protein